MVARDDMRVVKIAGTLWFCSRSGDGPNSSKLSKNKLSIEGSFDSSQTYGVGEGDVGHAAQLREASGLGEDRVRGAVARVL